MKKMLDIIVTVAVGIAALLIIQHSVAERLHRPKTLTVGTRLQNIAGLDWAAHDATLVLALRQGCHFCEQSMPFYRRLSDLSDKHTIEPFLVAAFPDDSNQVADVVRTNALTIPTLHDVSLLEDLKVSGTPTILLVDKRGVAAKIWSGRLTPSGEADVINAIRHH
jgi:hypothetical protein